HITYCMLGIGLLISQSILAFSAFKYAAAAYLVYLGIMSYRSGAKTLDTNGVEGLRPHRTWFVQGFVNNVLNPKGTLFYLGSISACSRSSSPPRHRRAPNFYSSSS